MNENVFVLKEEREDRKPPLEEEKKTQETAVKSERKDQSHPSDVTPTPWGGGKEPVPRAEETWLPSYNEQRPRSEAGGQREDAQLMLDLHRRQQEVHERKIPIQKPIIADSGHSPEQQSSQQQQTEQAQVQSRCVGGGVRWNGKGMWLRWLGVAWGGGV